MGRGSFARVAGSGQHDSGRSRRATREVDGAFQGHLAHTSVLGWPPSRAASSTLRFSICGRVAWFCCSEEKAYFRLFLDGGRRAEGGGLLSRGVHKVCCPCTSRKKERNKEKRTKTRLNMNKWPVKVQKDGDEEERSRAGVALRHLRLQLAKGRFASRTWHVHGGIRGSVPLQVGCHVRDDDEQPAGWRVALVSCEPLGGNKPFSGHPNPEAPSRQHEGSGQ